MSRRLLRIYLDWMIGWHGGARSRHEERECYFRTRYDREFPSAFRGRQWDADGYWCNRCGDMASHVTSGHDAATTHESPLARPVGQTRGQ